MVVPEIREQVTYLRLGALEPRRRRVVREHRSRDVEGDHDLGPDPRRRDEAFAHLRLQERGGHRPTRDDEQRESRRPSPGRRTRDEGRLQRARHQPIERPAPPALEQDRRDRDRGPEPQHPDEVRPRPMDRPRAHAGSLRSQLPESRSESAVAASAAATKGAKWYSYSRYRISLTSLLSSRSISASTSRSAPSSVAWK